MKVLIITPEAPDSTLGNSVTANRWADILRRLGHDIEVHTRWGRQDVDLLIALHARRSHSSVVQFREVHPDNPVIVALTGTDLYRDLAASGEARRSLAMATRIVALQEAARDELDAAAASKLHVIYQSARRPVDARNPSPDRFDVCVLSHLREVKDPLRAAFAARLLPADSRIRVVHAGRALEPEFERAARAEMAANPRYEWVGEQSHDAAMQLLARSRLLVLSSQMEGGASAIAEAVVCGVPVLCSDIPGNRGMLGADYPGYFRLRDTDHLAALLNHAETDAAFLNALLRFIQDLQPRFAPDRELHSWKTLLAGIIQPRSGDKM